MGGRTDPVFDMLHCVQVLLGDVECAWCFTRGLLAWKCMQSGAGAAVNPARRELKFLCMQPAAAAAQLMGSRLRGTWPMGIR